MSVQQGTAVVGMNDQRASTGNCNMSRYNAIKHGLTAKTPVLPGEDRECTSGCDRWIQS